MIEQFQSIISALIQPRNGENTFSILGDREIFDKHPDDEAGVARALNAAFFVKLTGATHSLSERAERFLAHMTDSDPWAALAQFYLED